MVISLGTLPKVGEETRLVYYLYYACLSPELALRGRIKKEEEGWKL